MTVEINEAEWANAHRLLDAVDRSVRKAATEEALKKASEVVTQVMTQAKNRCVIRSHLLSGSTSRPARL